MEKRKIIIGGYDTAATGGWTLSAFKITKGEQVQSFVSVPGRYAPLDLSTYLTDGEPYFGSATLEATLENSEDNRQARQSRIDYLVNLVDGRSWQITPPDHPDAYLVGRVQVYPQYNDLAHCAVKLTAICEPWLYSKTEKVYTLTATATEQTVAIDNDGSMRVVPVITTTGEARLVYGENSWTLSAGTYSLPDLALSAGLHDLIYSGSGTITITFREAVRAA